MLPSNIWTPSHIKNTCNEQDIALVLFLYSLKYLYSTFTYLENAQIDVKSMNTETTPDSAVHRFSRE